MDERAKNGVSTVDGHQFINLEARAQWDEALDGIPHAFAHTWSWCQAAQRTTELVTRLYCFSDGYGRVVCPLAERSYAGKVDLVTPRGFSGFVGTNPTRSFPRAWRDFARSKGYVCAFIGLHPVLTGEELIDETEADAYNTIYVVDLTLPLDELFRRLSQNRQRQLRNWERLSKHLILDRDRLIEFYIACHQSFLERRNANTGSFLAEETLRQLFDDQHVVLVGAGEQGRLEAVMVFAYTPTIADFLFNVSTPEGRRYSALLIWYGIRHLGSLGIPMLNLGGGIRPGDGVAQFKERFNPGRYPLVALKQIFDPEAFESICREARVDPANRGGFFPPYRSS